MTNAGQSQENLSSTNQISKPRLFYLDNLKILLIVLVVTHHAGQPYGPGGDWLIAQEQFGMINLLLLGLFFVVNSAFFMGLFFLISAFFVPHSFDRKGSSQFMKDRLIRLGTPIPFFVVGITPIIYYLLQVKGVPFLDYYVQNLSSLSLSYLWFPAMLLIFVAGYASWRTVKSTSTQPAKKEGFPATKKIVAFIAIMALVSFAVRIVSPLNEWSLAHLFEPAHLPQYVMMFAAGIIAYRRGWLDNISMSKTKLWSIVAVLMVVAVPVVYFTVGSTEYLGGLSAMALFWSTWEAVLCVSVSIALLGIFKRTFNNQGKIAQAFAANTYAVYLVHLPIVLLFQYLLIGLNIHPLLKFFLVAMAAVPSCFAISAAIRKMPYAKRVL